MIGDIVHDVDGVAWRQKNRCGSCDMFCPNESDPMDGICACDEPPEPVRNVDDGCLYVREVDLL